MSLSPCFKKLKEEHPSTFQTVTNRQGNPTSLLLQTAMGSDYQKSQTLEDNCLKLLENLRIAMSDSEIAPAVQETFVENVTAIKRIRPPMQEPSFLIPVQAPPSDDILNNSILQKAFRDKFTLLTQQKLHHYQKLQKEEARPPRLSPEELRAQRLRDLERLREEHLRADARELRDIEIAENQEQKMRQRLDTSRQNNMPHYYILTLQDEVNLLEEKAESLRLDHAENSAERQGDIYLLAERNDDEDDEDDVHDVHDDDEDVEEVDDMGRSIPVGTQTMKDRLEQLREALDDIAHNIAYDENGVAGPEDLIQQRTQLNQALDSLMEEFRTYVRPPKEGAMTREERKDALQKIEQELSGMQPIMQALQTREQQLSARQEAKRREEQKDRPHCAQSMDIYNMEDLDINDATQDVVSIIVQDQASGRHCYIRSELLQILEQGALRFFAANPNLPHTFDRVRDKIVKLPLGNQFIFESDLKYLRDTNFKTYGLQEFGTFRISGEPMGSPKQKVYHLVPVQKSSVVAMTE
jgi:hypothetical protein